MRLFKDLRNYMNNFDKGSISAEIKKLQSFKYERLCRYLKEKYGEVEGPYFVNKNCKTKNESIKRTNEGLFIHHIYEKQAIMLSHPEYAVNQPFEWQKGCNLVYCNYFEHMLLHVAIVKEFLETEAQNTKTAVGIGGLINYIIPEIIDYINGYEYARDYMKKALSIIDGNELLFVSIVDNLYNYVMNHQDVFSIIYKICHKSFRRFEEAFMCGKMTSSGEYNNYVFKYKVVKKQIKTIDSEFFNCMIKSALTKPGYNYEFKYRQYGEYSSISFGYHGKSSYLFPKEYAILSEDYIDLQKIKDDLFRKMIVSDKVSYLIKKNSIVSFKENKKCQNKHKKYCLTVDGVVVEYHNYTKDEAIELVNKNQ